MGRVINPDTIGKRRNYLMRTSAEMLRHVSQRQNIDDEAKDMLALVVISLDEIADGIHEATKAWEKRNYWIKIEEFERKWGWADIYARKLRTLLLNETWAELPDVMLKLFPKFQDVKIQKFTRKPIEWQGCYTQLLRDSEPG